MKCPHCSVEINPSFKNIHFTTNSGSHWGLLFMECPSSRCKKLIVDIAKGQGYSSGQVTHIDERVTVIPVNSSRPPAPSEVDGIFADDYKEACLVLSLSPKASAALSRRCLQNILREKAGVKKSDLANEIQEVINGGKLPSYLVESIDAVRNIGNFAAHPNKSKSSGEIVDVEPGEAEWLLDVLEGLFDFYFVQPAILKKKRDDLNKKLADAGKPQMK